MGPAVQRHGALERKSCRGSDEKGKGRARVLGLPIDWGAVQLRDKTEGRVAEA